MIEMNIRELRIGDRVRQKVSKFPMIVVGLFGDRDVQTVPDVEDYEGDIWEESVENLELVEPKWRLPEWKKYEETKTLLTTITSPLLIAEYAIDEHDSGVWLFFNREVEDTAFGKKVGVFPTVSDAKLAAERHYNELINEFLIKIENNHVGDSTDMIDNYKKT